MANWRDVMRNPSSTAPSDPERKRFLDAIASLSVGDAKSRVIAVAFKNDQQTGRTILCVYENEPVQGTVRHIRELLAILYNMAKEYAALEDKTPITPIIAEYQNEPITSVYCDSVHRHLDRYEMR